MVELVYDEKEHLDCFAKCSDEKRFCESGNLFCQYKFAKLP